MKILLAEDDQKLCEYIQQTLLEEGYHVSLAHDGEYAWFLAGTEDYDLIILDIMMPQMNGFDVLKQLREMQISIPILLLTARDSVDDKVKGLDIGADDYITKPFHFAELLARVRALGRRKEAFISEQLMCDDLVLDIHSHTVYRDSRIITLSTKEYSLLKYLLMHKGRVVTRTVIMEKIWDVDFDTFSDILKVFISRLRKKIDREGEPSLIQTIRGVGYMMKDRPHDT